MLEQTAANGGRSCLPAQSWWMLWPIPTGSTCDENCDAQAVRSCVRRARRDHEAGPSGALAPVGRHSQDSAGERTAVDAFARVCPKGAARGATCGIVLWRPCACGARADRRLVRALCRPLHRRAMTACLPRRAGRGDLPPAAPGRHGLRLSPRRRAANPAFRTFSSTPATLATTTSSARCPSSCETRTRSAGAGRTSPQSSWKCDAPPPGRPGRHGLRRAVAARKARGQARRACTPVARPGLVACLVGRAVTASWFRAIASVAWEFPRTVSHRVEKYKLVSEGVDRAEVREYPSPQPATSAGYS